MPSHRPSGRMRARGGSATPFTDVVAFAGEISLTRHIRFGLSAAVPKPSGGMSSHRGCGSHGACGPLMVLPADGTACRLPCLPAFANRVARSWSQSAGADERSAPSSRSDALSVAGRELGQTVPLLARRGRRIDFQGHGHDRICVDGWMLAYTSRSLFTDWRAHACRRVARFR